MMQTIEYINFKKERDLGAIITDTFKFLRLEAKPFFITILKASLVPILLAIAALLYYSFIISDVFMPTDVFVEGVQPASGSVNVAQTFVAIFFLFVAYILAYVTISLSAFYYIKSYVDNKGVIDEAYIKQMVKENFWSFLGLGILIGITVGIGMLFCFLPGIYFYVVFSIAYPLMVFSDKGVFDVFGDSFGFINGHWWETFGVIIVIGILVSILGYIFSIPALIYTLFSGFVTLGSSDPTAINSLFSDPIYIILQVVSYLGRFLFYAVTLVSSVFIYFDINEQKNATGTFEQIDNLGR